MLKDIENVWHSPINVDFHINKIVNEVGSRAVNGLGKYKRVREARIVMIVALIMSRIASKSPNNNPFYLQLSRDDPPDAVIMQFDRDNIGQMNLFNLEITSYSYRRNRVTCLDQLKQTKAPVQHVFSETYVILFHVDDYMGIDFEAINSYLVGIKAPYPVWILKEIQIGSDIITEFTFLNPTVRQFITVNVNEATIEFKKAKHPDILFTKRVAKVIDFKPVKSKKYPYPPWGDLK